MLENNNSPDSSLNQKETTSKENLETHRANSLAKPMSDFKLSSKVTDTLTENLSAYLKVRRKLIEVKQEHQEVRARIINDHGDDGARLLKALEVVDDFRDFYTNVS